MSSHGKNPSKSTPELVLGKGGEYQQQAGGAHPVLTTDQGMPIADNQNSLRAGRRGPTLLEDFILREKIFHFDHERIPERVVHARGSGAHGTFVAKDSLADLTTAHLFQKAGQSTEVFVRFSTVAGNKGSADLARDVRGFAVKFYTEQGNWDLVGNNIPVFFIQDAIKFPDLIHAAKQDPDRGFPQAATAHDTFWDWISLTPEAAHMVMWIMSDRTIPRSLRMMEGFGIHTFRMINAQGKSSYVKFHWRPALGSQSVLWDEAVKINGADADFHRRDLWNAIAAGDFPQWELGVQVFDEEFMQSFDFDLLDSTKIVPEEILPLRIVGTLTLDRNPVNFHAEVEQVAFCTSNIVPGIDFSDDPLLHGRNFSYLDTQLKRLGGPNFHMIPVNRARVDIHNNQRDGHMQMMVHAGQVDYEPSGIDADGPRASLATGFTSFAAPVEGPKQRVRSDTFADHYSQALQFFRSLTEPEQNHIVSALIFELSKCELKDVRARMLGQLVRIDKDMAGRVAEGLGFTDRIVPARTTVECRTDLAPSPALSLLAKAKPTLKGRMVGILITDGTDAAVLDALVAAIGKQGAMHKLVSPKVGGVKLADGAHRDADQQLAGAPSVLFDAVAVLPGKAAVEALLADAGAVAWVADAFAHLKAIGHVSAAGPLLDKAGVVADAAVIEMAKGPATFIEAACKGRHFDREPTVRPVF